MLHENALDLTHFPFVHGEASPYGYLAVPPPLLVEVSENSVSYSREFPASPLVDWQAKATGLARDRSYVQRESGAFVSPALHVDHMDVLASDDGGGGPSAYEKVFIRAFTPETAASTLVFWQVVRNYATDDTGVTEHLAGVHQRLMKEDKELLEDIQANGGGQRREMNVSADVAALRVQHIVTVMLAEERGRSALRPGFGRLVPRH